MDTTGDAISSRTAPTDSGESVKAQIGRVWLMSQGDETWDLSDNDVAALQTVLGINGQLLAALKSIMSHLDSGVLVRDVSRDGEPGWAIRMLPLVGDLQSAAVAIAKAEGR
jgi:hypothetical protein